MTSCARSPRPRGSAPTRGCSSTPRSTAGTPRRTPAGSTRRTRAREYMHLDNSACNLASINLLKYLDEDGAFDVEALPAHRRGDVHRAGDPRRQRRLPDRADRRDQPAVPPARPRLREPRRAADGAGPALRLRRGSRVGRVAHRADDRSRVRHQRPHRRPHGPVRRLRRQRGRRCSTCCGCTGPRRPRSTRSSCRRSCSRAAQRSWDDAVELGERYGVRNSQATRARTDRHDRPDDGLRHHRHRARPRAHQGEEARRRRHDAHRQPDDPACAAQPRLLATSRSTTIVDYIDEHKTIIGAPDFNPEHLPVFACSMGDNTIHYMGHVTMMGAVQPFLSGAISKTVNMPEEATVEEVEQLHIESWRLGLKAVAVYRDNCKVGQPLSHAEEGAARAEHGGETASRRRADRRADRRARHRAGAGAPEAAAGARRRRRSRSGSPTATAT